jgi:hypothetical protein
MEIRQLPHELVGSSRDPNTETRKGSETNRPISLRSCLCMLMERMVNRRLVQVLKERKLLLKQQFGFRKHRSTTDVLNTLNTHTTEAIRKGEYTGVLS